MRSLIVCVLGLGGCIQDPSLFIALSGDGAGRVVSEPPGIDCGKTCGMVIDDEAPPLLIAMPRTGSAFASWRGGGCAGIDPCTPDLTETTTIVASFTLALRQLAVTTSGSGTGTITSSPLGITCGADCDETYSLGTEITLTATPDAGSRFVGWTGEDECSATTPCNMLLDRDATIGAIFEAP